MPATIIDKGRLDRAGNKFGELSAFQLYDLVGEAIMSVNPEMPWYRACRILAPQLIDGRTGGINWPETLLGRRPDEIEAVLDALCS